MFNSRATWRVEVTFVATPPTRQIERASGVSEVEVDNHTIRCVVAGSFQPFLEAIRGREVIGLTSIPALEPADAELRGGEPLSIDREAPTSLQHREPNHRNSRTRRLT
jgi:hypothetical protein